MRAMALKSAAPIETSPLEMEERPVPQPGPGQVLVRVEVCGVCRTDLHIVEGELPPKSPRIVPGHEVVGRVERLGMAEGAETLQEGQRVGGAWLHRTDGACRFCRRGDENLCVAPTFTGYDVPGGYADYLLADAGFVYPLPDSLPAAELAPLLCAGIIGYRAWKRSAPKPGEPFGIYGFGASAHIVIQIARHAGSPVYVCTRGGEHEALASQMGAVWTGPADAVPPVPLRSSILFAPAGELVPVAMRALDRGGALAVAGIYLTPIPQMDYEACLFYEKELLSVTANTRADGRELLRLAEEIPIRARTVEYPLEKANEALQDLKADRVAGAAVLRVSGA